MATRLRFYDWRISSGPGDVGICQANTRDVAEVLNSAQRRLVMAKEAGDEGWWGTWAEMAFTMSRTQPYITLPREVARLEAATVCTVPIQVNNQFFEYLQFGNGRLPKNWRSCGFPLTAAYARNTVPTFTDLSNAPQYIAVYPTDVTDIEALKRVFIAGTDSSGNTIYTQDTGVRVQGQFLTLASPFVVTPMTLNSITGIQKDVTNGPVQFWQLDPSTGAQSLLLTMEPGEQSAGYRRYYFDALPRDCCNGAGTVDSVTVTAICKLDVIPALVDTDYLLLQGDAAIDAITDEAQAIRYSKMDSPAAKQMGRERHQSAIALLNGILNQYMGKDSPAVQFRPFGSARLSRLNIGMT